MCIVGLNQGNKLVFAVWHLLSRINTALKIVYGCLETVWHRTSRIGRKRQSFLLEEDVQSLEGEEKFIYSETRLRKTRLRKFPA
jgi:hypothetical protein